MSSDELADATESASAPKASSALPRRHRKRRRQVSRCHIRPMASTLVRSSPSMRQHRMTAPGLVDDLGRQRSHVVRAHQPPWRPTVERDVEQSFMTLALDDLGCASTGPDRFADPAQRQPRLVVRSTKARHAGRIRAGLVPSTVMSTNSTASG